MKIVILDGFSLNPGDLSWDGFNKLGDVILYDRTAEHEIIERISDAEIVITNKTPITKETIKNTNIKYIGVLATGYNVVDTRAAKEHDIVVTNIPSYGTQTVAQHTLSLLLEICHHVGQHNQAVKAGRWHDSKDFCFFCKPIIELAGKTIGIVGLGRIGKAVYNLAKAFGMNAIAFSRSKPDGYQCVELDELYKRSDVISLHCPLTDETEKMINHTSINMMKDHVIILNTSRGPLIDESALYDGLTNGKIYAAGIDVLDIEPPKSHHPIMDLDNCIITPHIAWASFEARTRLMNTAVINLEQYLKGQPINQVNY